MKTPPTALRRWWPVVAVAAYWALICWWTRGIGVDCGDGINAIGNSLRLGGIWHLAVGFDTRRPPAAELFVAPVASIAYALGGVKATLAAVHVAMAGVFALVLLVSHRFYRILYPELEAGVLLALLAASPVLIQFSPFAMQDIFSCLAVLLFVWASYSYLDAPDAARYRRFLGAYTLAMLSKYPLGILILAPLLFRVVDPRLGRIGARRRLERLLCGPLWLAPLICSAAVFLIVAAMKWGVGDFATNSSRSVAASFLENGGSNLIGGLRIETFNELMTTFGWNTLGPGLAVLLVSGWTLWLFDDDVFNRYLAVTLAVLFGYVASLPDREIRYLVPAFPLVYAAIGRSLTELMSVVGRGAWKRLLVAAACVAAVPWPYCARAVRFLKSDPAFHTRLVDQMAQAVGRGDGCISWIGDDIQLFHDDRLFRSENAMVISPVHLALWTGRRAGHGGRSALPCDVDVVATMPQPADHAQAKVVRLATIYRRSLGQAWDVYAGGVTPSQTSPDAGARVR